MRQVTFKQTPVSVGGSLPAKGNQAAEFRLVANDLSEKSLASYAGKRKVLNIFPSLDTGTCATSVRTFNEKAVGLDNTVVLAISMDLPFAQKRFCGAEGIEHVETLSAFRNPQFLDDYGVRLLDGPLAGLAARTVVVLDADNRVLHVEQVAEIADEPDYEAALAVL